jgi:hypothetical protein
MHKFLVFIDADKPYEVTAPSRCDATLDAMDAHRAAKRITVKPVEVVSVRALRGMRRVQGREDAERIREGGRS